MSKAPSTSGPGPASLQVPGSRTPSPDLSPPSGAALGKGTVYPDWKDADPRNSSTQSLAPSEGDDVGEVGGRRTLLMIYIHGFMGNDTSFKSFPAHIHNYLKEALADSHVIHSKIYPRYKTYKAIDVARDNFSSWLEPHESPTTDVVLLGHSMGGLLAAEIVLIPNKQASATFPYKHRILGTVSLDAPLLGLHPGIIMSGLASLFRPKPAAPKEDTLSPGLGPTSPELSPSISPDPSLYSTISPPSGTTSPGSLSAGPSATSMSSLSLNSAPDPNFNPPFWNDVSFQDRGFLANVAHFAKKHKQENIFSAAADHMMNHLEFGSCLADYPGLNSRYEKIRRLEDVDDLNLSGHEKPGAVRVRFVNYYTMSTGISKQPKPSSHHLMPEQNETRRSSHESSRASTPRISIEDRSEDGRAVILQEIEPVPEPESPQRASDSQAHDAPPAYTELDGANTQSNEPQRTASARAPNGEQESPELTQTLSLPAIPPLPPQPQPPNLDTFTDPEARKQAEKEAKRAQKAYDQSVKDRDKAVKERQKLIEKHRRKIAKEAEKREKEERKRQEKEEAALKKEADRLAQQAASSPAATGAAGAAGATGESSKDGGEKKKKERKFIMLPKKVKDGKDDTWIMVYMQGVDEVGAHTGLFLPGPHYERLIGDVGSRVVGWVHEDATRRAIQEMEHD